MTRQPDIRYVQFYTDGSVARKLQTPEPKPAAVPKPRARKRKRVALYVDPVASVGILVAAVMLVLMLVGVAQLREAQQELLTMQQYVASLEVQQEALESLYETAYDLEEVEEMALALGMVPKEQVPNTVIPYSVSESTVHLSIWEQLTTFFTGLFA